MFLKVQFEIELLRRKIFLETEDDEERSEVGSVMKPSPWWTCRVTAVTTLDHRYASLTPLDFAHFKTLRFLPADARNALYYFNSTL